MPEETMSRRALLSRALGRKPAKTPLSTEEIAATAVPEEERMMGWMSLRRQLLQALRDSDEERLARYVSLGLCRDIEIERLYGLDLPDERPPLEVVSQEHLGDGAALYTVRERRPSALSEALFGPGLALEAYFQVTSGRDWLLRELRAV